MAATYRCERCGRAFHPFPNSKRRFCSLVCSGAARTAAREERSRLWRTDLATPGIIRAQLQESLAELRTVELPKLAGEP